MENRNRHTDGESASVDRNTASVVGRWGGAFKRKCNIRCTSIDLDWSRSGLGEGGKEGDSGGDSKGLHVEDF